MHKTIPLPTLFSTITFSLNVPVCACLVQEGHVRVVLTWGGQPRDLDLHCVSRYPPPSIHPSPHVPSKYIV